MVAAAGWARPLAAAAALAMLAAAAFLPIWVSRLVAPQYPAGLWLSVFGGRIEGDVREINGLNHYIGMRTVGPDAVPELHLWTLGLVVAGLLALGGLFLAGRAGRLAGIGLWLVPLVVAADIQRWLYVFGHTLDREAALRLPPFTPLVFGPTTVWNFKIWAYPGPALLLVLGAAAVVSLARRSSAARARRTRLAALAAALVLFAGAALPARADASSGAFDLAGAIAATPAGGTLHVPPGHYRGPLALSRPIALVADGHVMIDGGGAGSVITVAAPDTLVRGFHLHGSGGQLEQAAGIAVTADRVSIEANRIEDTYDGVLVRGARAVRIVENHVVGRGEHARDETLAAGHEAHAGAAGSTGDGISLWNVEGALVRGNLIERARDGVYLAYVSEALLDSNRIVDGRYAVHTMYGADLMIFGNRVERNASGLVVMYTARVEASRNHLVDQHGATGYAVLLKDTSAPRLVENVIARNVVGIRAEGIDRSAAEADVLRNTIADNTTGVELAPSASLVFSRNSFVDNLVQVRGTSRSEWMKSGAGNYWSGYRGYDRGGDGLGDLAHVEGTSADTLLDRVPVLEAYRMSPGFALLREAERWWAVSRAGAVRDRIPLMTPIAPPLDGPARGTNDGVAWGLVAAALLASAAGGVARARR